MTITLTIGSPEYKQLIKDIASAVKGETKTNRIKSSEAKKRSGYSSKTLQNLRNAGKIKYYKVSATRIDYDWPSLEDYIERSPKKTFKT